jgi:hypothetical protein
MIERLQLMRAIAVGVLLLAAVAACLPPAGRLFRTTLSAPGQDPLPVLLGDQTDLVVGIEAAEADFSRFQPGVQTDAADPNSLVVNWIGGMCDNDVALSFRPAGPDFELHIDTRGRIGLGGCPAAGVLRALRIRTSVPITLDRVTITGDG